MNKEKIKIRKATGKDLKQILQLNSDLFKKEHKEYDRSLNLKWTLSKGKKYFKARISKKDGFIEVAEAKGEVVAYICGGIVERDFYREKAKYAELDNMLVKNKLRGRGIGSRLAKDFIKWCKTKKVKYLSVTTHAKNEQGIGFYKSLGFKEYVSTLEIGF